MDANLKRSCIHLGDADRAAIARIRQRLQLSSDALAIRQAIRTLAKRLQEADHAEAPTQEGREAWHE